MNERTTPGFAELVAIKFSGPLLLLISLILLNVMDFSWGLGFAFGAIGGLVGSYFSWLHLQRLADEFNGGRATRVQQSAIGGTLAGVILMAVVLAVSATTPFLSLFAAGAGLFTQKIMIGLTPFLRRSDGSYR
jgi:hypothetical protein